VVLYYSNYPTERSRLFNKDYSLSFLCRQAIYPDPMSILEKYKYKEHAMNFSNWEHPEFIRLLDRSYYEQEDQRLLTLEEAERLLLNEMPVIPLYHQDYVYIINPRLPFSIPVWWGDRMLLPMSSEVCKVQKENKNSFL